MLYCGIELYTSLKKETTENISRDEVRRRVEGIMQVPGEALRMELFDRYFETLSFAQLYGMEVADRAMRPVFGMAEAGHKKRWPAPRSSLSGCFCGLLPACFTDGFLS
jgi:hypothetical protein